MSDDILERLDHWMRVEPASWNVLRDHIDSDLVDAKAEIERLRAENRRLRDDIDVLDARLNETALGGAS